MRGDRGAGARENRGREGYGRRERKGREARVPKGREAGEIGENYVTLHNISQSKKAKREEAKKKGAGAGIARYGRREVWTPLSPPPPTALDKLSLNFTDILSVLSTQVFSIK